MPLDSTKQAASRYTRHLKLVQKIQCCTLRSPNLANHYGLAIQKYCQEYAVYWQYQFEGGLWEILYVSTDDKTLIMMGEPGKLISSIGQQKSFLGVEGLASNELDHDTDKKVKAVPSVLLRVKIPSEAHGSFYASKVFVLLQNT
eukprot:14933340-Ditylum_brightwellii.AAC.1